MALTVLIDGVDHISELVHETLTIDQVANRLNSTCSFDLIITDVIQENVWTVGTTRVEDGDVISGHVDFTEPKVEVSIEDGATVYFAGILSKITVCPKGAVNVRDTTDPPIQIITCHCHDFSSMLEESIVGGWASYVNKTDEFIIDDIFDKYVNSVPYPNAGIGRDAHVAGGAYTFEQVSFQDITAREFMDRLIGHTGYQWYISYDKELHYSATGDAAPAWYLSDTPDDVNSFSFLDPIKTATDVANLINRVLVMGETIGEWFIDQDSVDKYGLHQAIIKDASLKTDADLAVRGNALLAKFKDPVVTYTLRTYKDGLRAGMGLRLVCAHLNVDETLFIQKLNIKFPVDGEPIYKLTLGSLGNLLLAPTPTPPPPPPPPREWSHNIEFLTVDRNTVEWAAGAVCTSDGLTLNILAGDTGDIAADPGVMLVYIDMDASITVLQTTYDAADVIGYDKFHIATCWNGWVWAGFQVFGAAEGGNVTKINTDNIGDGEITDVEMTVAQLSAINANMGTLTAGTINIQWPAGGRINLGVGGIKIYDPAANLRIHLDSSDGTFELTSAEAGNTRIKISNTEIAGYDAANVLQFQLKAADGRAYAGAGAVVLDKDGIKTLGSGAAGTTRKIRFVDNTGAEKNLGYTLGDWGGGAGLATTWLISYRTAGDPWPANNQVVLSAADTIAGTDVRLSVRSGGIVTVTGSTEFNVNDKLQVYGEAEMQEDLRIKKGLFVGSVLTDPDENDMWCQGEISTDSGTTKWNLGGYGAGAPTADGYVNLYINGTHYKLLADLV